MTSNLSVHSIALRLLLAGLLCLCLTACAGRDGRLVAERMAQEGAFQAVRLPTSSFVLQSWYRPAHGPLLRIYIEGDGFAWRSRYEASADPTPRIPVGFALAQADTLPGPVAYLARPCQYVEGDDRRLCEQRFWTSHRYSEDVVHAMNEAVDSLKARSGASQIMLCGYSGGGAIAALLAERRNDVFALATVAGNVEVEDWVAFHRVTPLFGSLDPSANKEALARLPQTHVVGSADTVVPPRFARSWCQDMPEPLCDVAEINGMSHGGTWARFWPPLWQKLYDKAFYFWNQKP